MNAPSYILAPTERNYCPETEPAAAEPVIRPPADDGAEMPPRIIREHFFGILAEAAEARQ